MFLDNIQEKKNKLVLNTFESTMENGAFALLIHCSLYRFYKEKRGF